MGAAKARFFPTLSLTGLFGNVSEDLGDLFSKGKTWSIASSLAGPIFEGGRLRKNHATALARYEQSRIRYEAAVMNALAEVSTSWWTTKLVETESSGPNRPRLHRSRAPGRTSVQLWSRGVFRGPRCQQSSSRGDTPRQTGWREARGGEPLQDWEAAGNPNGRRGPNARHAFGNLAARVRSGSHIRISAATLVRRPTRHHPPESMTAAAVTEGRPCSQRMGACRWLKPRPSSLTPMRSRRVALHPDLTFL